MTAPLPNDTSVDEGSHVSPFWWGMRFVGIFGLIAACLFAYYVRWAMHFLDNERTLAQGRHLALSLINCESADGHYPAAYSADPNGRPLLSWRVRILPYLDAKPLYNRFHHNEPWDSPHNKQFLKQMPDFYKVPGATAPEGKT